MTHYTRRSPSSSRLSDSVQYPHDTGRVSDTNQFKNYFNDGQGNRFDLFDPMDKSEAECRASQGTSSTGMKERP
jgi:hypothetical protein